MIRLHRRATNNDSIPVEYDTAINSFTLQPTQWRSLCSDHDVNYDQFRIAGNISSTDPHVFGRIDRHQVTQDQPAVYKFDLNCRPRTDGSGGGQGCAGEVGFRAAPDCFYVQNVGTGQATSSWIVNFHDAETSVAYGEESLSPGAIAGIVIGSVVGLVLVVLGGVYAYRRKVRNKDARPRTASTMGKAVQSEREVDVERLATPSTEPYPADTVARFQPPVRTQLGMVELNQENEFVDEEDVTMIGVAPIVRPR